MRDEFYRFNCRRDARLEDVYVKLGLQDTDVRYVNELLTVQMGRRLRLPR